MPVARSTPPALTAAVLVWLAGMAAAFGPATALAHENHAPLPTKGVTVAGDNVLLSDKAREAIGLTTEKVSFGDLHRTVEVNARVELPWNQQAMITSLVPGKIDQVLVRPGETVRAGQPLAQVLSMELESLQLAMLQAASELDLAQRLAKQRRGLDAEGVIAGKSLLEAETTLAQKAAEFRLADEKLRVLGIDDRVRQKIRASGQPLRSVTITSPIDGVITHADVRIGQAVKPSDHLYHVVDPSRVWIVGEVLESDVRHLKKDQPVTAMFAACPEKRFRGVIEHVRLKMDRRTRTQSVVIAVDNPDGLLRSGMFGRVSIAVRVAKEAIVCPADAILKSRTGTYVLVQRSPGKYENRRVKLGLAKGEQIEVLEGVFPGNKVVVVGAYFLASLLGNEHKARTPGTQTADGNANSDSVRQPITVADATIELPTDRRAFAGSRIEGRIRRVLVEPSQQVEAGQVLAEVDSLQLRTAQLDLLQALSQLRLTEQSLARIEKLGERGVTPRRRVWELQNQRDTLRHRFASLERQLAFFGLTEKEIAELQRLDLTDQNAKARLLSAVPIRAPVAGWIVGFHVVPGQVVSPQDQLFEIHDLSKVWVKGYVFERDAAGVAVGQPAQVTFSAFPDLEAVGRVVRIAPTMEELERVLPVWVEVDNPDRLLKEGMLARVAILAKVATASSKAAETAKLREIGPQR
ncbi:MAG: efflux RND transporter periplasmic adaptor subunit [Planctomycetota bacterium]|jgi:RND family efflux transporter MFP subunit